MRILVTGGAGFIGSHIVEYFQGKADVRILDNLRTGHLKNLEGFNYEFINGSICDKSAVEKAVDGVDYIFHLAAMISVPESVEKPYECVDLNVNGTLNVLNAAAKAGVKKVVFSSSAAVYGDNPTVPKVETMYPEPKSPYAITKLDGEYYLNMFAGEGKLETASLRFFNVFGPRQDPNSAYAAAVPIFIERGLRGENITIYGDGEQTRDFVYVKDVVAGLVFAAMTPGVTGTYNMGYGQKITINDLAKRIIAETGKKSSIEYKPTRLGDVKHSLASIDKIIAKGFKHTSSIEIGLKETLAFFKRKLDL